MIPHQYRAVAFTDVDVALSPDALREHFLSRQVYRRTTYIVARYRDQFTLVEVTRAEGDDLFVDVTEVRVLAGPDQTMFFERPDIDTGVPSQLAKVAAEAPPGISCVVVLGIYGHVNFIFDEPQRRVRVLDVAPPWPAKLVDQVDRLLDTAEDLPATVRLPEIVDLDKIAIDHPASHYLLPCRGGGMTVPGAEISYLDEVPARRDWLQLGCARSQAIHDHFYPDHDVEQVDICPIRLAETRPLQPGEARLTKCCLLESHIETRGQTVVVPWGASFSQVADGLARASTLAEAAEATGEAAGPGKASDPGEETPS